jgi:hypothetical protein
MHTNAHQCTIQKHSTSERFRSLCVSPARRRAVLSVSSSYASPLFDTELLPPGFMVRFRLSVPLHLPVPVLDLVSLAS